MAVGAVPGHRRLDMKPWKAALGVGAACAACCTVPLLGGVAALAAGSVTLAAAGSALVACAGEFVPLAFVLLAMAAVGGCVILWRRRSQRRVLAASTSCGCAPGTCGGG